MGLVAGPNQYTFAGGDPINGWDPSGQCGTPDADMNDGIYGWDLVTGVIECGSDPRDSTKTPPPPPPTPQDTTNILTPTATLDTMTTCQYYCPGPDTVKTLLFGTHYCGVGGGGTPVNALDVACAAHDACYAAGGYTAGSDWSPTMSFSRADGLYQCNQALCDAALGPAKHNFGSRLVFMYFASVLRGKCTGLWTTTFLERNAPGFPGELPATALMLADRQRMRKTTNAPRGTS